MNEYRLTAVERRERAAYLRDLKRPRCDWGYCVDRAVSTVSYLDELRTVLEARPMCARHTEWCTRGVDRAALYARTVRVEPIA